MQAPDRRTRGIDINLIPGLAGRAARAAAPLSSLAPLAFGVLTVLAFVLLIPLVLLLSDIEHSNTRQQEQIISMEEAIRRAATPLPEAASLQATLTAILSATQKLHDDYVAITQQRVAWGAVLQRAVALATPDITLTNLREQDGRLVIAGSGITYDAVGGYVDKLKASGYFESVVVESVTGAPTPAQITPTPSATGTRTPTPMPTATPGISVVSARIVSVHFSPTNLPTGGLLQVDVVVQNNGTETLRSQDDPLPGYTYDEGMSAPPGIPGSWRIAVDLQDRSVNLVQRYRWGLGGDLPPGQSRQVSGFMNLTTPGTYVYCAGLVQEGIRWWGNCASPTTIQVGPLVTATPIPTPTPTSAPPPTVSARIVSAHFSPLVLPSGGLLQVQMVIENTGTAPLPSQDDPPPGYTYDEGMSAPPGLFGQWRIAADVQDRSIALTQRYRWGLGGDLPPGQSRQVSGFMNLTTPGIYVYCAGLVQEGIRWWGNCASPTTIQVGPLVTVTPTPTASPVLFLTPTSTPTRTPTQCSDSYEPDNDWTQARVIGANTSLPQHHTLQPAGDADWVKFATLTGIPYTIRTLNLYGGSDTRLTLYGVNITTSIPTILDVGTYYGGGPGLVGAQILTHTFTVTETGIYGTTFYVKIESGNGLYGCDKVYDLQLTRPTSWQDDPQFASLVSDEPGRLRVPDQAAPPRATFVIVATPKRGGGL